MHHCPCMLGLVSAAVDQSKCAATSSQSSTGAFQDAPHVHQGHPTSRACCGQQAERQSRAEKVGGSRVVEAAPIIANRNFKPHATCLLTSTKPPPSSTLEHSLPSPLQPCNALLRPRSARFDLRFVATSLTPTALATSNNNRITGLNVKTVQSDKHVQVGRGCCATERQPAHSKARSRAEAAMDLCDRPLEGVAEPVEGSMIALLALAAVQPESLSTASCKLQQPRHLDKRCGGYKLSIQAGSRAACQLCKLWLLVKSWLAASPNAFGGL